MGARRTLLWRGVGKVLAPATPAQQTLSSSLNVGRTGEHTLLRGPNILNIGNYQLDLRVDYILRHRGQLRDEREWYK